MFDSSNPGPHFAQLHPLLQKVVLEQARRGVRFYLMDCYRDQTDQALAFAHHRSMAKFGQSPHNFLPALAFDQGPFPLVWDDLAAFHALANATLAIGHDIGVNLEAGADWKNFKDYPHIQLANWRSYT